MATPLFDKAIKSAGGKEEFQKKFEQYKESVASIEANRDELLKKYDNEWIAVYNRKVVAHAKKLQELIQKVEPTGLPTNEVLIEFISSRKVLTLYYI